MGQEAGKSAWPKPAGGYQTITGRRYGRRHAYVSFRPNSTKNRTTSNVDWQEMEMSSVSAERAITSKGNISSMLQAIFPVSSNSVHPEVKTKSSKDGPNRKQSSSRGSSETSTIQYKKLKGDQAVACDLEHNSGLEKSAEASAWPIPKEEGNNPSSPGVLSFVNIDAYEPESSAGEEDELGSDPPQGLQKRLDDMISELGKEFDYLSGLHSYLYTKTSSETNISQRDASSKDATEPSQDEPVSQRTITAISEIDHMSMDKEQSDKLDESAANASPTVLKGPECMNNEGISQAEMVVRPKIRKQTSETHLEKRKCSEGEETHRVSTRQSAKSKCGSAPPFFLTQTRPNSEFLFDFPPMDSSELNPLGRKKEDSAVCGKMKADDDDDLWEDLEEFNEKCAPSAKGDESSECSEGEWSASWTSDSGLEKERRSSEESWETLPGLDELQSNSSSLEDVPQLNFTPEEQTPLEEGEIPWLMYNEETGSSSDEDPDGMSHFVHPGLFILDGNNNLEDDSSMSEDLDTEWRLLDDFGEGFGMAQAISYVDPQLLTYMALEERLAQAMEAALAHLESLAIDVEQAHPPATEQIIECLPQITVLDDHSRQEQCCAICCCEYVNDEIATQLPCHHMFHKLCVTLWLRKSGTCPVCRHILTPALTEGPAPAPTSFVLDQDNPPSNHSTAGMR